jgi:phosphatidylserine decarboxylase
LGYASGFAIGRSQDNIGKDFKMAQGNGGLFGWVPPSHPEGQKFWIATLILAIIAFLAGWGFTSAALLALTWWVYAFFRDPVRQVPQGDDLIVSPADGTVCLISEVVPPADLDLGSAPRIRVCIFMNVFDVHINRAPMQGQIRKLVYVPGKFLNADLDKASEENERQLLTLRTEAGVDVGFVQIAGLVARRIVRFVREGDRVLAGERIGLIRFGSRVDVYLPQGCAPKVALGQRCVAGETILARLGDGTAAAATAR